MAAAVNVSILFLQGVKLTSEQFNAIFTYYDKVGDDVSPTALDSVSHVSAAELRVAVEGMGRSSFPPEILILNINNVDSKLNFWPV